MGAFLANLLFFVFSNTLMTTAVITGSSIAAGQCYRAFLAAFLYRRTFGADIPPGLKAFSSSRPLQR